MIYVDNYRARYRGMFMCHMLADTTNELLAMADTIGVDRKHLQDAGTVREHFDVCVSKRDLAIRCGAKLVGPRDLVAVIQRKRCPQPGTQTAGTVPAGS
jgi:hypothetical protein